MARGCETTPPHRRRIVAGVQWAGVFAALYADPAGDGRQVEVELQRRPRGRPPLRFPVLSGAETLRLAACLNRFQRLVLEEAIAASTSRAWGDWGVGGDEGRGRR